VTIVMTPPTPPPPPGTPEMVEAAAASQKAPPHEKALEGPQPPSGSTIAPTRPPFRDLHSSVEAVSQRHRAR
jgi:hypothetical protein